MFFVIFLYILPPFLKQHFQGIILGVYGIFRFAPISANPQGGGRSVTIYTPAGLILQELIFTSFEAMRLKKWSKSAMRQIIRKS